MYMRGRGQGCRPMVHSHFQTTKMSIQDRVSETVIFVMIKLFLKFCGELGGEGTCGFPCISRINIILL